MTYAIQAPVEQRRIGRSRSVHPLGSRARVLLASVFGPYAQDDEYGSRTINPMELYHNQVSRVQGPFSLRMFHRSWGLMLIQANIDAPCALLDFPTLDRFIEEIRQNDYDIVGISSIAPNIGKVQKMCALIRQHLPAGHDRGGRPHRQRPRHREADRRGSRRARGGRALVPELSRRGRAAADSPSPDRVGLAVANHGHPALVEAGE